MKISVINLNPGVDRISYLSTPARLGTLNRACRTVISQGSKGANVAIMLRRFGHRPAYFTFSGGPLGHLSESFTDREDVDGRFTKIAGGVRMNVKIIDKDRICTEFNESGGPVTPDELAELVDAALDYRPDLAVINGSLPVGVPPDIYGKLASGFNERGVCTVLDADGDAMRCGLDARPRLIKPNLRELSGIVGCEESQLDDQKAVVDAMLATRARYGCDIICTLDSRGAIGLDAEGMWHVSAAPVTLRGFSGAGDTFLAAYLHSRLKGDAPPHSLAYAAATAGAKVELEGTALPDPTRAEQLLPYIKTEIIFTNNT